MSVGADEWTQRRFTAHLFREFKVHKEVRRRGNKQEKGQIKGDKTIITTL